MERFLIGIDDTDNETSRGTGFLARMLARDLEVQKLGSTQGITRHQLFFDPRIPYTSQNSSACLDVRTNDVDGLANFTRSFLVSEAADGSDVGLGIMKFDEDIREVIKWGLRAKEEVLTQAEAKSLARENGVLLEGLTGSRDGIIGALAGLGLRMSGDDGRFIWLKGREIRDVSGIYTSKELINTFALDQIAEKSGYLVSENDRIDVGDWFRPALVKNRVTLIVEKSKSSSDHEWEVASKEYIKSLTA